MKNLACSILCMFAFCSAQQLETEWINITNGINSEFELFLNSRGIVSHEGGIKFVTVWTKMTTKKPKKSDKTASLLKQSRYNCRNSSETIIHTITYTKQGAVYSNESIPDYNQKEESIPPGTYNELILREACKIE